MKPTERQRSRPAGAASKLNHSTRTVARRTDTPERFQPNIVGKPTTNFEVLEAARLGYIDLDTAGEIRERGGLW